MLGCSTQPQEPLPATIVQQEATLQIVALNPEKVIDGQTVYVPVYSHIYHHNSPRNAVNLSATLSIRNTDPEHAIVITSVRYFNSEGELIRQDITEPSKLGPLASVSFFVAANDISGGAGANFLVDWVTETAASEPVIEAVMISTTSSQGISFVSPGRVVARRKVAP
ncbi:MAG: DUF3124 domain-containing protein [Cyanobacteriota bacterium]